MRYVHLFIRRIRNAYRTVASIPAQLDLFDRLVALFAFPQHKWARRLRQQLSDESQELTWRDWLNPICWTGWSVRFLFQWLATRPYLSLAPAIPAVLVVILMLATVVSVLRRDEVATQTVYLDKLRDAIQTNETSLASVAAQRLLQIDPENLEHQFQLALLDEELGKFDSARTAMVRLGLQSEYGPAALWLLRVLVYQIDPSDTKQLEDDTATLQRRQEWTEDERKLCHRCATIAITQLSAKRSDYAKRVYAEFLSSIGNSSDALRLYQSIARSDPSVALEAARIAAQANDYNAAQQFAQSALQHLEPKFLANPTSVDLRIAVAQAMVLDEQDDEAYRLVVEGMQNSSDPRLPMAAGEALIFKAERLRRNIGSDETLLKRAQLLLEALKFAPNSPYVMQSIVQLAIECGDADDEKLQRVRQALLSGVSPAAMHFIEGTVLLMAGDTEAAQQHLELAMKDGTSVQSNDIAGLFNNLAVALSQSSTEQLPQALRFAEEALRRLPNHPFLLETRGQIHLKMKNYQDAISDLEGSLADPRMRELAHTGLAKAYAALGIEDLAEENLEKAQQYGTPAGE